MEKKTYDKCSAAILFSRRLYVFDLILSEFVRYARCLIPINNFNNLLQATKYTVKYIEFNKKLRELLSQCQAYITWGKQGSNSNGNENNAN